MAWKRCSRAQNLLKCIYLFETLLKLWKWILKGLLIRFNIDFGNSFVWSPWKLLISLSNLDLQLFTLNRGQRKLDLKCSQQHWIWLYSQWLSGLTQDFGFLSVQSGIYNVQISLRLSQTFCRVLPWDECPCTSRKPKSDRLWKSLVWYLEKVPPGGYLNASGYSEGKPSGCALGFAFGTSLGFRFARGGTFSR